MAHLGRRRPFRYHSAQPSLPIYLAAGSTFAKSAAPSVVFTATTAAVGVHPRSATASVVFTATTAAVGVHPRSATASVIFTAASSVVGVHPRAATASIIFTPTTSAAGVHPRSATAPIVFTASSTGLPAGVVAATVPLVFHAAASSVGVMPRAATAAVVFTAATSEAGVFPESGTSSVIFTATSAGAVGVTDFPKSAAAVVVFAAVATGSLPSTTFAKSATSSVVLAARAKSAANAHARLVFTAAAAPIGAQFRQAYVRLAFSCRADPRPTLAGDGDGLVDVLRSGLSLRFPLSFAEVPDGVVLMANGVDPMLRWDGTARAAEPAGVPAPAAAPTMTFVGYDITTPVATSAFAFTAYVRFLDRAGNVSDFSPISADGQTSATAPIRVNGAVVSQADAETATGLAFPFAVATTLTQVAYANVPVPTGPYAGKVFRRQVLRNTAGQATTWYVDVDTQDLTSTDLVSHNTDADLLGNEAVPFLDDLGLPSANTHGFPPSHKLAVVQHLGRVFAAGEVVYDEGHVAVTGGSATVTGVDTDWPVEFVGRRLYIPEAPASYEIAAVDRLAQVITLAEAYQGPTNVSAFYAIRPAPAERRLVYYTPAGEPESWPATYALSIQEDGDEITGLMTLSSFLYILERKHIYRFTFKDDPATDGAVFLSSLRGCLSHRMWVQAEDAAYMMDEQGVHQFSGGTSTPVSAPIQDLFRDDTSSPLRVDWQADQRLWHAAYSEVHGTIRFFVAMTGTRLPRHAICYNYRDRRWWVEEYKRPVTASTAANIGIARVLCGTDHREMLALNVGWTDGARDVTGSLRGAATGHTAVSLTDSAARFASDTVNLAVFLVSGPGRGQWRRIVRATATRLDLLTPWTITPRAGDEYVVAGVDWRWRGGWFRFTDEVEADSDRSVELAYQPNRAGTAALRLFYNHGDLAREWDTDRDGACAVVAGESDVTVDLTARTGRAIMRLEGRVERYSDADRYVSPELSGVQVSEPVRVYRATLNGVEVDG